MVVQGRSSDLHSRCRDGKICSQSGPLTRTPVRKAEQTQITCGMVVAVPRDLHRIRIRVALTPGAVNPHRGLREDVKASQGFVVLVQVIVYLCTLVPYLPLILNFGSGRASMQIGTHPSSAPHQ